MPWGIIEDFLNEHGGPQVRDIGWHELPLSVVIQYAVDGDAGAIEYLKQLPPPPPEPPPLRVAEHQGARAETFEFDEDKHPRDERGRWGPGDGGGSSSEKDRPTFPSSAVEPVRLAAQGKSGYALKAGLDAPEDKDWKAITADPARGAQVADHYDEMPSGVDPDAIPAYRALAAESDAQFEYLTKEMGVKVEFVAHDPYRNVGEMTKDLRENSRIQVLQTAATGSHPFFTDTQNDHLRAVHDVFGHAAIGRGFDRNGEEAAYQSHRQMFSERAIAALTTETRGQNSALVYGDRHEFPEQKVAILPREDLKAAIRRILGLAAMSDADDDNLYAVTGCHHTSLGRTLGATKAAARGATFYREDQARDHGRFVEEGGGGGGDNAKASDPEREAENARASAAAVSAIIRNLEEPDSGFTIDPDTGKQPITGYAVAYPYRETIVPPGRWQEMSRDERIDVIDGHMAEQAELYDTEDAYVGGWHNPDTHEIEIEPSQVIADRTEAVEMGWINNQRSVADLAAIHERRWGDAIIPSHGSGARRKKEAAAVSYDDGRETGHGKTRLDSSWRGWARHGRHGTDDRRHHGDGPEQAGESQGAFDPQEAAQEDRRDDRRGAPGVRGGDRGRDRRGVQADNGLEAAYGSLGAQDVVARALDGDDMAVVWLLAALDLADDGSAEARAWFEWNEEDHPRDERGRFDGGGGGAEGEPKVADTQTIQDIAQGDAIQSIAKEGTPEGAGTPDDPLYVDGNYEAAVQAMAEGKSIRMDDKKQAVILTEKLGAYAQTLRSRDEKPPDLNLCNVTAPGGSVFCGSNIGIARVDMPQLRAVAKDGTPAADLRQDKNNSNEEVDAAGAFTRVLEESGVKVTSKEVPVNMLRASQNELNGGKVGFLLGEVEHGKYDRNAELWITKDGYVLDGHHRWAALFSDDLLTGGDGQVRAKVREVDMEIGAAIDYAKAFGRDFGLQQAGVGEGLRKPKAKTAVRPIFAEWNEEDHPRDERGRFGPGGADSPDPSVANASIPGVGNVKEYLDKNPPHEGEKIFEYQSRICQSLPVEAKHEMLWHVRERYPVNEHVAQGASDWRASHGLPDPQVKISEVPAPRAKAEVVAEYFEKTPDQSNDPEVRAAYDDFKRQNAEMYDYMTKPEKEGGLGIKVDFSPYDKGDPYPSATEQANDVRDNHHITIQSGLGGDHTLMTTDDYDRFRAVHDTFGHAGTGAGFDRHGEYQTYLEHRSMYTEPGSRAMATEYHGSNTSIWSGSPGTPGTGKSILLPESLIPQPWDKNGRLVKASAQYGPPGGANRTLSLAPEPIKVSDGIKALAAELDLSDTFAAEFDRLPWHYAPDGRPSTAAPPLRAAIERLVPLARLGPVEVARLAVEGDEVAREFILTVAEAAGEGKALAVEWIKLLLSFEEG